MGNSKQEPHMQADSRINQKKVGDPKHTPCNGSQEGTGTEAMLTEQSMASIQAKGSDGTHSHPVVSVPQYVAEVVSKWT